MGLFDAFKKKPEKTPAPEIQGPAASAPGVNAALRKILDDYIQKTSVPSIALTARRGDCGLTDSKFGGAPYLPRGFAYPADQDGVPLRLLAQLNFDTLPKLGGFPQTGILQFYIGEDDLMGADYKEPTRQNGFRVVYHETVSGDPLPPDSLPAPKSDGVFPFSGQFALDARETPCPMTSSDYRFDGEFMEVYRKYVKTSATSVYKLDDGVTVPVFGELSISGHRVGGCPYFTQDDPRDFDAVLRQYTTLLLQVDSCGSGADEIQWGDSGAANFLIRPGDLARLDFSDVFYYWDCC